MMIAKPPPTAELKPTKTNSRTFVPTAKPPSGRTVTSLSLADQVLLDQILTMPCEYTDHPSFHRAGAEKALFGAVTTLRGGATHFPILPVALRTNGRGRKGGPLKTEQEQMLFQRFNYARFRVSQILDAHEGEALSSGQARLLLAWAHRTLIARSEIVQANVPLVLAMAKRTRLGGVDFGELVSEGNMALLRSVDKFDCTRGFKFSTYACRAILKSFSRVAMRTSRYRGRFPTEFDPALEKSDFVEHKRDDVETDCVGELREILNSNRAELSEIEKTVIRERFALEPPSAFEPASPKTLEQVGVMIGVTKERVRQIQNKALQKIRVALESGILAA